MSLTTPAPSSSSAAIEDAAQRAAYWPMPIARAVPAAGLALVITFSADHSAQFGLLAFGVFGVVAALVLGAVAWLRLGGTRVRPYFLTQAAVTLVAGVVALLVSGGRTDSTEVRYLFLVLTVFTAVTGFLELYSGVRSRRRFVASGDWIAVGAITVAAALAFVLIPPDYRQVYAGPDHVKRVLDASVVAVGALGALAAISAVFLVIAGLSAKWGTQAPVASTGPSVEPETMHQAESENRA
ncbi:hypothetical protein ACVXZ4_18220 [Lacisediminihabitans sp. FW035]